MRPSAEEGEGYFHCVFPDDGEVGLREKVLGGLLCMPFLTTFLSELDSEVDRSATEWTTELEVVVTERSFSEGLREYMTFVSEAGGLFPEGAVPLL